MSFPPPLPEGERYVPLNAFLEESAVVSAPLGSVTRQLPFWAHLPDNADVALATIRANRRTFTTFQVYELDLRNEVSFRFRSLEEQPQGPVPGWRWWLSPSPQALALELGDPILTSPFNEIIWPETGPLRATNRRFSEQRMNLDIRTHEGIYACARPRSLDVALDSLRNFLEWPVLGVVVGWGTVIEHSDGWRAEYAQPLCLIKPTLEQWDLSPVAERYGVPVVSLEQAWSMGGEF